MLGIYKLRFTEIAIHESGRQISWDLEVEGRHFSDLTMSSAPEEGCQFQFGLKFLLGRQKGDREVKATEVVSFSGKFLTIHPHWSTSLRLLIIIFFSENRTLGITFTFIQRSPGAMIKPIMPQLSASFE